MATTSHRHGRPLHHLSQRSSDHSGWMEGVASLGAEHTATQLLSDAVTLPSQDLAPQVSCRHSRVIERSAPLPFLLRLAAWPPARGRDTLPCLISLSLLSLSHTLTATRREKGQPSAGPPCEHGHVAPSPASCCVLPCFAPGERGRDSAGGAGHDRPGARR